MDSVSPFVLETSKFFVCSNRVSKLRVSFQYLLTSVGFPVLASEVKAIDDHDDDDENVARNATVNTGAVVWTILRAEYQRTRDPANPAEADHGRGAESSLPMTTDVIGLVGHACRNATLCTRADEEGTEVSDTWLTGPTLIDGVLEKTV